MILKPQALVDFLNRLHWTIITWDIDVGTPIETAIDWVLGPVNAIADWAAQVIAWWEEFRQEILDTINMIRGWFADVWTFITGWIDTLGDWINTWWSAIADQVKDWIEVARQFVLDRIGDVEDLVNAIGASWDNFTSSILPTLVTTWGADALIRAALAPFRDIFNWFEMVKDDLVKFFSDPWAWLYDKFDEFFERFW